MGLTDLEEQFTFYASYHHSPLNKLVHIICVWPILWTAFVLAEYVPLEVSQLNSFIHPFNLSLITAIFYAAIYISMDKRAGTLGAILVFACLITARKFYLGADVTYGMPAWQLATLIHIGCWIGQFLGHGVFEGRAPALFDNLTQAFVMAPLFVLLEVMFPLGYRKDFQTKVSRNVEKEIAKFKATRKADSRKLRK